jgi:outer membrane protein OmpA-like peptidoglycan-associated protein
MKKLVLVVIVLLSVFSVKAQYVESASVEDQYPGDAKAAAVYQTASEKQIKENTSGVRTTWVANKPNSNWFFSLEGGAAYFLTEDYAKVDFKDNLKPTVGFSVGKWFSPVWGLRLNATAATLLGTPNKGTGTWYVGQNHPGVNGKNSPSSYLIVNDAASKAFVIDRFLDKDEAYKEDGYRYEFSYAGASLDFLVNLKNLFTHYNPKAFFNPVVHLGVGYANTFREKERSSINSVLAKGGLQFNFRLGDRWDLYLDAESLVLPEYFDRQVGGDWTQDLVLNAKLGLTYRFNFRHFIKAPLADQALIDALNAEINELRNRPQVVCPPAVVCPEPETVKVVEAAVVELTPVFFTIDSYVVRDAQLLSVAKAAQYLVDNPGSKIEIAAYADKKTGNPAHNLKLSENRAKAVANVLTNKFGIDKSRLKVSFYGDKVQPFGENDKNRVAIFVR